MGMKVVSYYTKYNPLICFNNTKKENPTAKKVTVSVLCYVICMETEQVAPSIPAHFECRENLCESME